MFKASEKAYVSKKLLEKYSQQKTQQQTSTPVEETKQTQELQKEEEKQTVLQNNLSEDEDYLSVEEVDSDDLGEDITQKRSANKKTKQVQQKISRVQYQQDYGSEDEDEQEDVAYLDQMQQMPQQKSGGFFNSIKNLFGGKKKSNTNTLNKKIKAPPKHKKHVKTSMKEEETKEQEEDEEKNDESKKGKRRYRHQVDTNVFQVSMACLKDQTELATGDPVYCTSCKGIFNKYSKIIIEDNTQVWECEFCGTKNKVHIDTEEIPKNEGVSYIVEASAQVKDKEESKTGSNSMNELAKDISIVYCIDVSGSMDERQMVQYKKSRRNDGPSRLECVRKTIQDQIKDMKDNHPERKVGLVTFSDDVKIIGDGKKDPILISSGSMNDYNIILKNGIASGTTQMNSSIKNTHSDLDRRVKGLKTEGSTALGPGLLASIALAGEGKLGSQVIVCTDGQTNIGVGCFGLNNSEDYGENFYRRLGEYAQSKGVTVHIVTIIGAECNIDGISVVSEMTGGHIERVNPSELQKNFKDFLSRPVLATKVQLKVKLHQGLEFRNELPENLSEDKTILTKDFGNVNEDTDITFEYKMKSIKRLVLLQNFDLLTINHLPFQAQINYTALDGSKCVRVITNVLEISNDREELEKKADFEILGVNAVQQSSKLARKGEFKRAQVNAKAWDNRLKTKATNSVQSEQLKNYRENIGGIYGIINQQAIEQEEEQLYQNQIQSRQPQQQQQQFLMQQNQILQDDDDMNQLPMQYQIMQPQQQQYMQQTIGQSNRRQMNDMVSQQLYSQSKISKAKFSKKF